MMEPKAIFAGPSHACWFDGWTFPLWCSVPVANCPSCCRWNRTLSFEPPRVHSSSVNEWTNSCPAAHRPSSSSPSWSACKGDWQEFALISDVLLHAPEVMLAHMLTFRSSLLELVRVIQNILMWFTSLEWQINTSKLDLIGRHQCG